MVTSMKVRIERLEAELAEYRRAFEGLISAKIEIAQAVDGSPSREQLLVTVATLREALRWSLVVGDYKLREHNKHILRLLQATDFIGGGRGGGPSEPREGEK